MSASGPKLILLETQAKGLMGITRTIATKDGPKTVGLRNFSHDVLKVEVSGPDRSHFSILDVPGIFQTPTKDLKPEEKSGVSEMVASYMAPKQSVIM